MISYHIASTWQLEVPLQVMQLSKAGKTCRQGRWKRPTIWLIWDASPVHPIKPPWTVWRSSVFCCWYVRVHELLKTLTIQNFSVVDLRDFSMNAWKYFLTPIWSMKYPEGLVPISFRSPSSPTLLLLVAWCSKHGKPGRKEKPQWLKLRHFFLKTPWGWQNS